MLFAAYGDGMGVLFLLFFVLVAHASSSAYNTQTPHDSRLLILFLDGLRWDYLNHLDETGGIGRMRTQGCHVPRVKPVFPANCYNNMHALFAGTFPFALSSVLFGKVVGGYSLVLGHNLTNLDVFNDKFEAEYTHPELLWNRALKQVCLGGMDFCGGLRPIRLILACLHSQGKSVKLFHFPFCSSLLERGMDCIQPVDDHTPLNTTLGDALQSLANHTTDLAGVYRLFLCFSTFMV